MSALKRVIKEVLDKNISDDMDLLLTELCKTEMPNA
jgi:hypothetical protein